MLVLPPAPCARLHRNPNFCVHHAHTGGLVVLGALGALTNDSNISPLFPAYREPPPPCRLACTCAGATWLRAGMRLSTHQLASPACSCRAGMDWLVA